MKKYLAFVLLLFFVVGCTITPLQHSTYTPEPDQPSPSLVPGMSWYWQLDGVLKEDVAVDVYDVDFETISSEQITQLHQRGVYVICYLSAGTWEPFRDDASLFSPSVLGKPVDGWEEEKWLDISRYQEFASIMEQRLDGAAAKGCDAIEPDNVDGYTHKTGFSLSAEDQLTYNRWLAEEAHQRGLQIGLKNNLEQVPHLVEYFDFAINEQCFEYDECETLLPFIEQGKPVFGVEYELERKEFCTHAAEYGFSWFKATYDLNGQVEFCQ